MNTSNKDLLEEERLQDSFFNDEKLRINSPYSPLNQMSTILLKVASICNLNCKYCYWFRDKSVYNLPNILSKENEKLFIKRLSSHLKNNQIKKFKVLFHGGEPLLFPLKRFRSLCDQIILTCRQNDCSINFSVTTNGMLIDSNWIDFFLTYSINPTISLDGPKEVNDRNRIDFLERGSFECVIKKINLLKENQIEFQILSVINIESQPKDLLDFFFSLKLKKLDFLLPDFTHDDIFPAIGDYLIELFDLWYKNYSDQGLEIRFFMEIIRSILSRQVQSEVLGGPFMLSCIYPDGSIRPHDVLGIISENLNKHYLHLANNELVDIENDSLWDEAYNASIVPPQECNECLYKKICNGGYTPHRWSKSKKFNNKSIYCKDLYKLFDHIQSQIFQDITINQTKTKEIL